MHLEASMLTDQHVAILCDIAQPLQFDEDKLGKVRELILEGYAEKDGDRYKLTAKGEKILSDRGAGLDES
jgi:predicted transcriptional regulator